VAKQDLGTKRLCPNCGARYYDLNKDPPVCPKCGTVFVVTTPKSRPPEPKPVPKEEEPVVVQPDPVAETISLEEADEELAGAKNAKGDGEEDEDIEVEGDDDDDAFLEEDEDEGDDVTGIIGDVDEEEE
jgi:uncharacterized protein (TIGR02300 family)